MCACHAQVSGCLPVIDWLQSVTEASDFAAATDVEQWLYEWQNKASPGFEHLGIAGSTQPNGVAPSPAKAAATAAAAAHTPAKALPSPAKAAPSPAPAASTPEKTAIPRATKAPESPASSIPAKTAIPRATKPSDSSAKKSSSMDPPSRKGSVPAEDTLLALCRNVSPKALSQMIDSLDRNHDGMITYMELHSGLVKLGIDVEAGHLRQIVCRADENDDGRVSRAELEKMLTKMGSTPREPVEPPSPAKRPSLVAASELEREIDRRISALEGTLTEKDVTIEMLKDTVEYLSRRVQWLLDPSTKANKRSQPTNPDKSPAASPVEHGKKGKRTTVLSPQQDPQHVKGLLKKEAGVVLISEKKPNSRSSLSLGGQDDERGSTAFEKHVARSSSNRRASFIQGQLGHEAALKNPQAEEMLAVPGTEKTHFQTWEQRGSEGARVSFGKAQTMVYGPATYFPSADAAKAPIQGLALEYAYGYNGRAGRGSVFLSEQRVVYPLASIGVVRNRSNGTQWFFQRHSEEITCMAIHPQRALVASGQAAGRADGMASIRVWDSSVRDTTQLAQLSFHTSGVIAVAFSVDGTRLVSVGAEQGGSKVALWDWNARSSDDKPAVPLMTGLHGRDKPLGIAPLINGGFVSHGASSAKFWWVDNGTLQHERARFDDRQLPKAILGCLSVTEIVTVMAADNGNIYLFEGFDCKYVKKGHDGPINCVAPLHDANGLAGFATGGSDGQIHFWNPMYEVTHTYDLHELQDDLGLQRSFTIRSLDLIASDQQIIVGTKENEVYEIDVATKHSKLVTRGHNGNVRALAAHPSKPIVATGCDDAGVRFWDVRRHELLRACSFPRAVTAVALSSASEHAAVGLKESQLAVDAEQHKVHLDTHRESWGEGARQKLSARNHNLTIFVRIIDCETGREIVDITHPQPECVTALRYSPMANFLCVGTRNGQVYTYNVKEGYAHMHVVPMPKGTGSIMSISFTTDERYFACTSMDGVLHFVETHNGHRVMKAASMRDNVYADWSLTMGFQCQERYPQGPPSRAATRSSRTPTLSRCEWVYSYELAYGFHDRCA
jgi:WD40 repeat protein